MEWNPEKIIGDPVSILDTMHDNVKDGDHYFSVDDDDWDDSSEQEAPLTWSLDEPSNFCDWTIEVVRIRSPSSPRCAGKDKKTLGKSSREQREQVDRNLVGRKSTVQHYHVHKAILSVG